MNEIFRLAATLMILAGALLVPTVSADERILILSAYPTEQAVLLSAAAPVEPFGVFNGRRFFSGTIGNKSVVLGLTGIGLVNAEQTTTEALDHFAANSITPIGIVFSGVAGGPHIGDVVIPEAWRDASGEYPVDAGMLAAAGSLAVPLNPFLPVEDAACVGVHSLHTPIRVIGDPVIHVGGFGASSDPYGGRAVPCLSHAGGLIGCEACGAPPNPSPGVEKFVSDATPFFDPQFFQDLFDSFASPGWDGVSVVDMETAAVARLAVGREIPFLAFRAASDAASENGGDPIPVTALVGFPVQFAVYQQLAADNAAAVVLEFLDRWNP